MRPYGNQKEEIETIQTELASKTKIGSEKKADQII